MIHNLTSIQPPSLVGVRYKHIFLFLQISNAIRYYICPEEYNFQMPQFTYLTLLVIVLSNAFAFFHGLDGTKQNWILIQKCMLIVLSAHFFNVAICYLYYYKENGKWTNNGLYRRDRNIHLHEAFITFAMFIIAWTESKYYDAVKYLEKTNAEYGSRRPKKQRRRQYRFGNEDEKNKNDGDSLSKLKNY